LRALLGRKVSDMEELRKITETAMQLMGIELEPTKTNAFKDLAPLIADYAGIF